LYDALPEEVRSLADKNYLLLKSDPKLQAHGNRPTGEARTQLLSPLHDRLRAVARPKIHAWLHLRVASTRCVCDQPSRCRQKRRTRSTMTYPWSTSTTLAAAPAGG